MIAHRLGALSSVVKYLLACVVLSVGAIFYIGLTLEKHFVYYPNLSSTQYDEKITFFNQSSSTYHFQAVDFYPHLPIQIYTANRQRFLRLQNVTRKVILLGNTLFQDPTWGMRAIQNHTNAGNMSELLCPFMNDRCEITNERSRFREADAVVYHIRDPINLKDKRLKHRHPAQRFIFALWESPRHTPDLRRYENFFNWTMTYRFDSHIFAGYHTVNSYHSRNSTWFESNPFQEREQIVLHKNIDTKRKSGTVGALISNCLGSNSQRPLLIAELQKYVDVTVYGKCGKPCPTPKANETSDCRAYIAEHYYFFLSFENSYCIDYATEKFFETLSLPIVPVVFGRVNYTHYVPESGFIDVNQFGSIAELAQRLSAVRNNDTLYQQYFRWKENMVWDGFTQFNTPFCDLCLRLHLDTTPNVVENIHQWWFDQSCL